MPQQNHQAMEFQQESMQPGFQNQGLINQPMNLGPQVGGQQAVVNLMFPGDRALQRHVQAYQQMPDPQPPHRQDVYAYWANKIAEVMRDQFGIKPKVNLLLSDTVSSCVRLNSASKSVQGARFHQIF